jgi:hypothetical protein
MSTKEVIDLAVVDIPDDRSKGSDSHREGGADRRTGQVRDLDGDRPGLVPMGSWFGAMIFARNGSFAAPWGEAAVGTTRETRPAARTEKRRTRTRREGRDDRDIAATAEPPLTNRGLGDRSRRIAT